MSPAIRQPRLERATPPSPPLRRNRSFRRRPVLWRSRRSGRPAVPCSVGRDPTTGAVVQAPDVAAPAAQKGPTQAPPPRGTGSRLSLAHVITLLAGLLAMLLVFTVLRSRDATWRVAGAGREIKAGTPLDRSAFRFTDMNAPADVRARLLSPAALDGMRGTIATRTIAPGELASRSASPPAAAGARLRAMSVPVDPAHAVGGALSPGDRVDVVRVQENGLAGFVITNAQVLSVNQPDSQSIG